MKIERQQFQRTIVQAPIGLDDEGKVAFASITLQSPNAADLTDPNIIHKAISRAIELLELRRKWAIEDEQESGEVNADEPVRESVPGREGQTSGID